MKKLMLMIMLLVFGAGISNAFIDSYVISRDKLPETAREFLDEHYPKAKVSLIKIDCHLLKKTDYDVKLTNGVKIQFSNAGKWKSVKNAKKGVPAALVPKAILRYVNKNHSEMTVTGIGKKTLGYEIFLSDGAMLKFDLLTRVRDKGSPNGRFAKRHRLSGDPTGSPGF